MTCYRLLCYRLTLTLYVALITACPVQAGEIFIHAYKPGGDPIAAERFGYTLQIYDPVGGQLVDLWNDNVDRSTMSRSDGRIYIDIPDDKIRPGLDEIVAQITPQNYGPLTIAALKGDQTQSVKLVFRPGRPVFAPELELARLIQGAGLEAHLIGSQGTIRQSRESRPTRLTSITFLKSKGNYDCYVEDGRVVDWAFGRKRYYKCCRTLHGAFLYELGVPVWYRNRQKSTRWVFIGYFRDKAVQTNVQADELP